MTEKTIQIEIVSPEQALFSGQALSVVAPGAQGELGIYPQHTPLLTQLKPGTVRINGVDGKQELFYVASGILEVQPYKITILADTAMRATDLDEAQAEQARQRSETLLANKQSDKEYAIAASELAQALAQIRTLKELRKRHKG
jgi:F-type H+-transporting ATPase subunit epsilon